jgi:hypothetical protein
VSDYLPPVVVELEGKHAKLLETLTAAKAEVRRFTTDVGAMRATVNVKADLAAGEVQKIQRRVGAISATVRVALRLDDAVARAQLDDVTRTRNINARVGVKLTLADGEVQKIQERIGRIKATIKVKLRLDTATTTARLNQLTRDRTVTITTRTVGGGPVPPGDRREGGGGGGGGGLLAAVLPLAPALVPIAAQATALAASIGAATVAVGVFGVAVKSQLGALSAVADAQGKAGDAVAKYGSTSKQAAQGQQALTQTLDRLPTATRTAAGTFLNLKSNFKAWSDSMAKFTMVPVTQGLGVLDALLPKLSPLVKDTSGQFTRLTTALAGGVNSGAFDGLMSRFTTFANGALQKGVDGVLHFARVLSQGGGNGPMSAFLAYVRSTGPIVGETLKNLGLALMNILKAASQAGPGMLTLVNAFAKLVAALPPSLLATLMQVALAIKVITLTRTGMTALGGSVTSLTGRFTTLRGVAVAAGGGLAGLRAAFLSLGTAAKATVIIAVVAAIGVAVAKLASLGQKAPPDIDKLTNSFGRLGQGGKVQGEALKSFGANLDGLRDSMKSFVAPSVVDNIQQGIVKVLTAGTTDSTPVKQAKENLDAIDKSLANLVQGGHADLAAAALEKLKAAYGKGGHNVNNFTKNLTEYKKAVDDAKFSQELAAQSQGLFGQQAQATQKTLDAQKASADGLRQSLQALNDVQRSALDGEIGFQAAIDAAAKAVKDNGRALHMRNGVLDLSTEKARNEAQTLSDLAAKTEANAAAARDANKPWGEVTRIYDQGRAHLVAFARQMGLSKDQAKALADQILKTPNKTSRIKMDTEDATRDLNTFNAAVKKSPGAKSVTLKTLSAAAEKVLSAFGFKVTHLKDGSVKIVAKAGGALSQIGSVSAAISNLNGKTATTYVITKTKTSNAGTVYHEGGKYAQGGLVRRYADGGSIEGGSGTRDDVPLLAMGGEFIVNKKQTNKYRRLLDAINEDRVPHFAKGGLTQAQKSARSQLGSQFGISLFGKVAGYQIDPFERGLGRPADLGSLVSALNGLHSQIKAAFNGKTESSLLKQLDKAGKSLISYDKQLTKVTSSLASAKTKLDDLKNAAAQVKSSVASSIMSGASVVTQAPQDGFGLTSADVVNSMAAQVQKAQQFTAELETLKKRGLSGDLLDQIAAAGVDQGGATAAALTGASDAQIKQLNSLQKNLKSSANKAGSAVADAMYGAGIKAAEGLVKGLEKQQKAIEAAMLRIAKSMEKALKAALGIHSPSTVMANVGDFTALGFAHGITRSSKHAVIAARGMAMSVAQGATLTGSPTWAGISHGGGGPMVVHNHYHAHVTVEGHVMTERNLRDVVEKQMTQLGARNSQTWQPFRR